MDGNTIRYNVLLGVDSLFSGTSPGYNDRQISSIINRAQRRVFRDRAKLFDTNEKIKSMLSPLLKRASYVDHSLSAQKINATTDVTIIDFPHTITGYIVGKFLTLPSESNFIVEETAKITKSAVTTQVNIVLPITYDYINKNYKNRYKKPSVDLIWRLDAKLESSKRVVELVLPEGYTVNDYIVSYLKYPVDIVVDTKSPFTNLTSCEITDPSFNDEIIGEAIKIITASLNDSSYEIEAAEKKFDEN